MFEKFSKVLNTKKITDFLKKRSQSSKSVNEIDEDLDETESWDEEEIEEVEKKETLWKKVVKQAISTVIKTQIKVYLLWIMTTLIGVLMPIIIVIVVTFIVLFIIYYFYISSLQSQYEQKINDKQLVTSNQTQSQMILWSHWVTRGWSWVPVWSPTNWQFSYSTFQFHENNEHLDAIDFLPTKTEDIEVRSTQAGDILYIWNAVVLWELRFCIDLVHLSVSTYWNTVIIWNKDTWYITSYLHLDTLNPDLQVGSSIWYWTFLGYMWNTWCSTDKHLHYEVRKGAMRDDSSTFPGYWHFTSSLFTREWYPTVQPDEYLSSLGDWIKVQLNWTYLASLSIPPTVDISIWLNQSLLENLTKLERSLYGPYIQWIPTPCGIAGNFPTTGVTEEERARNFLQRRATLEFSNYNDWSSAWLDWSISPTALICMAVKETTLWHTLKTPNNVWNVWNVDSWWTRDFLTPVDGITAMWKYALNNRYLSQYNELIKLSYCGDPEWRARQRLIYSSSDTAFNDVFGCITSLKNVNIPFNWNFRLSPNNLVQQTSASSVQSNSSVSPDWTEDFISDESITKFVSPSVSYVTLSYVPQSLVDLVWNNIETSKTIQVRTETRDAVIKLSDEYYNQTKKKLPIVSWYRSYKYQESIATPIKIAQHLSAKAGYSEHQSWFAVDLFEASTEADFLKKYTIEYNWLKLNAYKFWFTQSYQVYPVDEYVVEPWHWRYVGVDLATKLKDKWISFTQYYKLNHK